jgi:S-adenosyl-L-methionine hydrolase (adenosine-forming)
MPGMAGYDWITFTSDYGLEDHFVGVCHGVMARVAPRARVVDVCHAVGAQDVRQGANVLAQAVPYLPRAVHLAVVDPGVGTGRGMVAVGAGGQVLVGPDNGLLVWAAEALGGVDRVHALENPAFRVEPVSRTFHGRDVFAPAAAHLAAGVDPAELGPELDPEGLVRLERPAVRAGAGRVAASVVAVDHFGNLALDLGRRDLAAAGMAAGDPVEVRAGGRVHPATVGETFASVPAGELVVHEDSFGSMAVAVNLGRAADRLGTGAGDRVEIVKAPAPQQEGGG